MKYLLALLLAGVSASAQTNFYSLADFGPLKTPADVKAAYAKAKDAMASSGGLLFVPAAAAKLYEEENTSQLSPRTPPFPAQTQKWTNFGGPGITVVEQDENGTVLKVPSIAGLQIERTLRMPLTESLPHWTTDYALKIHNNIVHGSQSYLDFLQEPVEAGPDAKFYVATIRGLRVGMFANCLGKNTARLCIKSLGYDAEKKMHYFTADTSVPFEARAVIQNKSNEGVIWMAQKTHADEQTYDIMLNRDKYGLGDTYMYFARFRYMGNNHSAGGDENANIFAAYTENLTQNFNGTVEATDWENNTVKFAKGPKNPETLGASRPIINLNKEKWITQGKIIVVPAESYWDTVDTGKYPFEGKTYPTTVVKGKGLRMGGLIRGDKDCPWDDSIIGRWIAINEETERVWDGYKSHRTPLLRWYQIMDLTKNPDGTKDITIQRFWWGAKTMDSPTLYRTENNTWDGHIRPLSYVIAPGTYVAEVSRAVPAGKGATMENLLGVAPYRDAKTKFDFEKGDPIEQAVGPDPFVPIGLRLWAADGVPGAFPAPILDLNNMSPVPRYAAMWVRGGPSTLEALTNSAAQRPRWDNAIVLDSAADVGINWKADFANAAILFQQPNHEQPIKWLYATNSAATLTVAKETGVFNFSNPISTPGLSADKTPSRNLRGKDVAVKAGETSVAVSFPVEEADASYAVFIEKNWLGDRAITKKDAKGFTIQFEKAAPADAKLDWMIVR